MNELETAVAEPHWKRVRRLVRPWRPRILILVVASFLSGAFEALFLVVVTRTALAVANDKGTTGLVAGWQLPIAWSLAIATLLLVVRTILGMSVVLNSTQLQFSLAERLRNDVAEAFLRSSWATQQEERSGRLQELVSSFVISAIGVMSSLTSTLSASMSLIALLAIAVVVDPIASLVVIAALLGLGSILAPIRRRIRLRSRLAARRQMELAATTSELSQLGLEMQAFGVRERFIEIIADSVRGEAGASRRANFLSSTLPVLYTSLAFGAILLGLAVAAIVGVRELSAIGAVMLVMLRSLSYGSLVQTASGSLMRSLPFLEVLDTTMARYRNQRALEGEIGLDEVGAVEANRVSFSYNRERIALNDFSFRLESGEIVGVIGPSGAGKSTLVQLLLGVREPDQGVLTVGGVPLASVDRTAWTRLCSYVAQEPRLITGTVAENIRFFRADIDDDAVRESARAANVLDDIESLPQGFDTHLGERGSQLSGGQRQRISIARALARSPRLLILDEPTSALDPTSEALIRETVRELRGRVTVVIIAHRMSTLDICDRLMVIEGGRLMAFDVPEQLRLQSEFYRQALILSGIT